MYVCLYIYIYVYVCIYIYICLYIYIYRYVCIYIYMYVIYAVYIVKACRPVPPIRVVLKVMSIPRVRGEHLWFRKHGFRPKVVRGSLGSGLAGNNWIHKFYNKCQKTHSYKSCKIGRKTLNSIKNGAKMGSKWGPRPSRQPS